MNGLESRPTPARATESDITQEPWRAWVAGGLAFHAGTVPSTCTDKTSSKIKHGPLTETFARSL